MLHQSTQRRLCRALFLSACLVPTFAVVGGVAWRMRPAYRDAQLQAVAQGLGVRIECDRCVSPKPGRRALSGVRLLDPETGAPIAQLDSLRLSVDQGGLRGVGGVLTIAPERLGQAGRLLAETLRGDTPPLASITLQEIRCGEELLATAARLVPIAVGQEARGWSLAEQADAGARLRLLRNRQLDPPQTRLTIDTGARRLAWSHLAGAAPLPANLGPQASFTGVLTYDLERGAGALRGDLQRVELAAFMPAESGVQTLAAAELREVSLAWVGGRFESLDLSVHAGAGRAAWWFADHASRQTGCVLAGPMLEAYRGAQLAGAYPAEPLAFDRLAMRVQIDPQGCRVTGLLPSGAAAPSAVGLLERSGQTMLTAAGRAAPLANLAPLVQTHDAASAYACPRAVALLQRLPEPSPPLRK